MIDDLALVGLSAEAFSGTHRDQDALADCHTNVLGFSNGCVMYLPRAQDYPREDGTFTCASRSRLLFQNYLVRSRSTPGLERRSSDHRSGC